VCVAELLVDVRASLLALEKPAAGETESSGQFRPRTSSWHLRRAMGITSRVAGDHAVIKAVLREPDDGRWWTECVASPLSDARTPLPGRRHTASWQAAYNTACLYAALADAALTQMSTTPGELELTARAKRALAEGALGYTLFGDPAPAQTPLDRARQAAEQLPEALSLEALADLEVLQELERRVIKSLRYAVDNPYSELERPSDWVETDPDFHLMAQHPDIFARFALFRCEQQWQDYPAASVHNGVCPVAHDDDTTSTEELPRLPWVSACVLSPVPGLAEDRSVQVSQRSSAAQQRTG
jgi:hypothetical protein